MTKRESNNIQESNIYKAFEQKSGLNTKNSHYGEKILNLWIENTCKSLEVRC